MHRTTVVADVTSLWYKSNRRRPCFLMAPYLHITFEPQMYIYWSQHTGNLYFTKYSSSPCIHPAYLYSRE